MIPFTFRTHGKTRIDIQNYTLYSNFLPNKEELFFNINDVAL